MKSRLDEFRSEAAECQELANRCGGECKRQYEELVREWQALIERVERQCSGVTITMYCASSQRQRW
jgi:hypothetical protein